MSSFLRDEVNPTSFASMPKRSKATGGFVENVRQSFQAAMMQSGSAAEIYVEDTWEPIIDEIESITGKSLKNPGSYLNPNAFAILSGEAMRSYGKRRYDYEAKQVETYVRANRETLPPELVVSVLDTERDQVWVDAAKEKFHVEQAELAELTSRSPGLGNTIARLTGSLGAGITDPINQASMALPASWSKIGKGLLGVILGEAIVNASVEAIQQPDVAAWYKSLGLEYGWEEFRNNVGQAAVIGGAFPVVLKVGGETIKLTAEQVKRGARVLNKAAGRKSDAQAGAEVLENSVTSAAESTPLVNTQIADIEHKGRLVEAELALSNGKLANISDVPVSPVRLPENVNQAANLGGVVFEFDPNDIGVDAKTFQFKEGGDEFGVTDRLWDVTQWDPVKGGMVTVYEYADGRLFIADGHQRLGLAKRISKQDPTQKVKMIGYRLREIDGISPEDAMVTAALKNISEGTGTAIDAAKVLRTSPQRIGELPPRSAFVRQATDLANLVGEAWGMVKNEVVAPNFAAIVGRLIPGDEALQKAALDVLAKTEPANIFQAESIVRQVRETSLVSETQENLFGDEVLTTSLFMERANILDRAQKQLRKDKSSFQNLIKNATRLEDEGNLLAKDANQKRAQDDGKAVALLQSQANRKGALSDALTAAARNAKETGSYNAATTSFIEDVRRAISTGEFDRAEVSDAGRSFDAPDEIAAIRTDAEEGQLDAFDDAFGPGVERQTSALYAGLRQDMADPNVQRQELQRAIDNGATEEQIINHPAVIDAIDRMAEVPVTSERAGFPQSPDDISAVDWFDNRRYIVDGSNDATFDEAVRHLVKGARELGWIDDKLDFPAGANRSEKKAVIILGPPASGKSTIANPIARKMGAAIVDADEAKKILPEYQGGIGANAVHEESSLMSDLVFKALIEQGDNLVIPKVGGKLPTAGRDDSIERMISILKSKGYAVELLDMKVSASSAMKRVISRFVSRGRFIAPDYIRAVGDNPSRNFDRIKEKGVADGYYRIDNEGGTSDYKDVSIETGSLLDGVELRLRRGGVESGPEIGRAGRKATVGAGAESIEQVDLPSIKESFLDEEFPLEVLGEVDAVTNEPVLRKVTARQLLDEIDQDDAMIDALSRCPI